MVNLSDSLIGGGKVDEALSLCLKAPELREKLFGAGDSRTLDLMRVLARIYQAMDMPQKALPLLEKLTQIETGRFGQDHPETLYATNLLIVAYMEASRFDDAAAIATRAYESSYQVLGLEDPRTLSAMVNLACFRWILPSLRTPLKCCD